MQSPNIIVVMTDQQRADASKREGFPLDTTPFLDELAKQGTWFNRAYTTSPMCSPARISFLTGRYPSTHGERTNVNTEDARYGQDIIDVLQEKGYRTAMIGKNHSHLEPERTDYWSEYHHNGGLGEHRTEDELAFDDWLRDLTLRIGVQPTPFPLHTQSPYRIVSEAAEWVSEVKEQPFFLWLSIPEPHNPYQVPEPYFSMFPPEALPPVLVGAEALAAKSYPWRYNKAFADFAHPEHDASIDRARSNYYGMMRLIDDQVKRFVDHLDSLGLMENTLLVFVSDHGDFTGEYGLLRKGPELPELLMRIPLFIVGPNIIPREEPHSAFVSIADLMPTLCEVVGADIPLGVQGRSLLPLLRGEAYPATEFTSIYGEHGYGGFAYDESDNIPFELSLIRYPNGPTFNECNPVTLSGVMRMVRTGKWKLIFDNKGNGELYDLEADPRELNNRFGETGSELQEVRETLLRLLLTWILRLQDPLPKPRGPRYKVKRLDHNYSTMQEVGGVSR